MSSLKLQELAKKTWDKLVENGREPDDSGYVTDTLAAAIEIMGFSIDADGTIVDPRPAPPVAPADRWRAPRRRR